MVSRKQHVLTAILCAGAIAVAGIAAEAAAGGETGKKFYSDDPLWKEPAPRPVTKVAVRQVDEIYDFLENSFVTPRKAKAEQDQARPARNVNTLGEVPDSGWYTNRHWLHRMTIAELVRGPGNSTAPGANDSWTVVSAKSDGVTPGFVIEDHAKNRYLLKFDPPESPELSSGADVIGSKFFYALGYNTPENYVVHFRRENLVIAPGVKWRDATGKKHPLTPRAMNDLLRAQYKDPDGSYRGLASRWIPGETVGPFDYQGSRSDDPNDTVRHEDRRELRGLKVFSAWLNHTDTKSINSMDSLVNENGRKYLKHYLIDFGSILGAGGDAEKEPWMGHEYPLMGRKTLVHLLTFGLMVPRWMRSDYPDIKGVGLFDSWSFDPVKWRSNYPNPAFLKMDDEDAFWAAKQVASFTDDEIRALVKTGEYTDPRAVDWITECLIKRRDKIAEVWFSRKLPLDKFHVAGGRLEFEDLGKGAGAARTYDVKWSSFDNNGGQLTALPGATGRKVPPAAGTGYLAATIACTSAAGACPGPVTVYVRSGGGAFQVVGVDR